MREFLKVDGDHVVLVDAEAFRQAHQAARRAGIETRLREELEAPDAGFQEFFGSNPDDMEVGRCALCNTMSIINK